MNGPRSTRPATESVAGDTAVQLDAGVIAELVATDPRAGQLWCRIDVVDSTGSTNHDLTVAALGGAPGGRVLVAGEQTAGRGRFDRTWSSPPGTSVALSLLVRPRRPAADWGWLSVVAGMAVAGGLEQATAAEGGRIQLKWPNDVLVDGAKICGILSERVETSMGPAAVVGIGLNIAQNRDELPVPTATSLRLAGLPEDANNLVAALLRHFARWYGVWEGDGDVRDAYRERCASLGRPLRVMIAPDTFVEGVGVDIDNDGCLVVETSTGRRSFAAGDVFHLR